MAPKNLKLLIWFIIALAIALAPWVVLAQNNSIKKQKFNIDKAGEDGIGYAQAVKVGKTIYISGTVAGGDMATAVKNAYSELEKTLKAYGATFQNVVKENVFTTNLDGFIAQQDLRKTYYNGDFPSASWVEVRRLYSPDLVVEVELIAELP